MVYRNTICILALSAIPALPCWESPLHAGVVLPNFRPSRFAEPSIQLEESPWITYTPRVRRQADPSSGSTRLPTSPVPPRIQHPSAQGPSSYMRLPPIPPTAYESETRASRYAQPWETYWPAHPVVPHAAFQAQQVRKPFADYRPMPAISPYSYLHADDPYDVPYYYLYVKPLLETQSPDDY